MDKMKILIVDDEKDLVMMVAFLLRNAGYEVVEAYDGIEGLEKAKKEKPHLIILDLMLPAMNGYQVCASLKADSEYDKIPVIIFSAKALGEDKEMGRKAGADAYVTKPFEQEELLSKIRELLHKTQAQ